MICPPSSDGCGLGADSLQLTNGSALHFNRREEPKLLLDRHTNLPLALYNVVDDSFLYNETRIIVQVRRFGLKMRQIMGNSGQFWLRVEVF